jgi:hypothetical protein
MPMYYFHLRDTDEITDVDGTELADIDAARRTLVEVGHGCERW